MKILHIIFTMKTGGLENLLLDIANAQAAQGHQVAVMIVNSGSEAALLQRFAPEIKIIQIGRHAGSRNPIPLIRVNVEVLKWKPDVIHVHNETGVNILLPGLRRKVVQTIHTTGINLTGCQLRTPIAAISEGVAADLKAHCGVDAEVIMNGVQTDTIRHRSRSPKLERLVCVGRMNVSVKGQDLLLKAMPYFPELSLSLIGDGADLEAMKELAVSLGIADRVTFCGAMARGDIYQKLADFDAFVLPSRQEGFGLVAAEAMAAGLPIVSVDLPGPMEIIAGGELGYSFKADDVDSLVAAIKALDNEWTAAQERALSVGLDYVRANFSVATTAARYLELYHRHRAVNE